MVSVWISIFHHYFFTFEIIYDYISSSFTLSPAYIQITLLALFQFHGHFSNWLLNSYRCKKMDCKSCIWFLYHIKGTLVNIYSQSNMFKGAMESENWIIFNENFKILVIFWFWSLYLSTYCKREYQLNILIFFILTLNIDWGWVRCSQS
jgi:hypothetical protein